ncbi:MAG: hypothetical protein AB8B77_01860 [Alphaproteobacteria bacterium]
MLLHAHMPLGCAALAATRSRGLETCLLNRFYTLNRRWAALHWQRPAVAGLKLDFITKLVILPSVDFKRTFHLEFML